MKEEILKLIEQSFLTENKKQELISVLNKGVDKNDFFDLFNQFLIEDINIRKEKYQFSIKNIDDLFTENCNLFLTEKKVLDDDVEKKLLNVSVTDVIQRDIVWNEYYKSLNLLNNKYEIALKNDISKVVLR